MRGSRQVLLGLITLSFGATAVAISAPVADRIQDEIKPITQGDDNRPAPSDVVIRTRLDSGESQQLIEDQWVDLTDTDKHIIIAPVVDFDGSELKRVTLGETEDLSRSPNVEKVTYEYRYRRGPAFYFPPRYRGFPPPAVYAAPPCAAPLFYRAPCAEPGYLYAPPPGVRYDIYRPRPAYRIAPYRTYQSNGFYYRHFRRW